MRGLLVVGACRGAQEATVAAALQAALARAEPAATPLELVALGATGASPLTAARHAGTLLDPAGLVAHAESAEGPVLATAAGGLLAPLTPRYAVRDLAGALGLPLVLAVPAVPDLLGPARLNLEAARGAGLAVAAVVLTGWPDPPDRVLLDERRLLEELGGVAVQVLPAGEARWAEAARAWPVADWLEGGAAKRPGAAAGPGGSGAPAGADGRAGPGEPASTSAQAPGPASSAPARVVLEPYTAWTPRALGDPRSTPRPVLMAALLDIVAAEGPMVASRAYALANRAGGGKKLTSVARAPLSSAAYWLARERRVTLTRAEDVPWQGDDLLRLPDAPAVRVRELGPRALEEVPLDEVADLMRRLRAVTGRGDAGGLKRAVLGTYGLVRLTARADEYLGLAHDLMA